MSGGARPNVKRMKKQSAAAVPITPTSDPLAEAIPDVNHQQLLHEKARLLDHRDRILKSHEREATDQMHQIAALKSIAVKYENNIATLNDELRLLKLANQSNDIPNPSCGRTHSSDKCKHGGLNKVQRDCVDELPSCHHNHYGQFQHLPTCPHCHMLANTQRSEHNTDSSLTLRMLEGLARLEAKIDIMTIYGKNHQHVIPTPIPTQPNKTAANDDGNSITPNVTRDRPIRNSHMNFRYAENIRQKDELHPEVQRVVNQSYAADTKSYHDDPRPIQAEIRPQRNQPMVHADEQSHREGHMMLNSTQTTNVKHQHEGYDPKSGSAEIRPKHYQPGIHANDNKYRNHRPLGMDSYKTGRNWSTTNYKYHSTPYKKPSRGPSNAWHKRPKDNTGTDNTKCRQNHLTGELPSQPQTNGTEHRYGRKNNKPHIQHERLEIQSPARPFLEIARHNQHRR